MKPKKTVLDYRLLSKSQKCLVLPGVIPPGADVPSHKACPRAGGEWGSIPPTADLREFYPLKVNWIPAFRHGGSPTAGMTRRGGKQLQKILGVRVPASTSNLGPGFDVFGLALRRYLTVYATVPAASWTLTYTHPPDHTPLPLKDNFIVEGYKRVFREAGQKGVPCKFQVDEDIPVGKGWGSSAAAYLAGLLLGNELLQHPFSRDVLLRWVSAQEGHADNAAASLYGGLVAVRRVPHPRGSIGVQQWQPSPQLVFFAFTPGFVTSTPEARRQLPKTILFQTCVDALGQIPFLLELFISPKTTVDRRSSVLPQNPSACSREFLKDSLHEPYRGKRIPHFETIRRFLFDQGAIHVFISGSGPTLMSITLKEGASSFYQKVTQRPPVFLQPFKIEKILPDREGAKILRAGK